ncbi:N-acetylglucosamine kinase [Dactylosporangium sp. CA-233914]|uniref:N-acetylglucosamine kinase n=1 Tax=Dactylosporangium sp. CA-233914 TaxID=3239934 RepID=UPI003D8E2FB9
MSVYLGVDAGNSKTVALVCDDRGTVLGWGRAGIGDIYGAPDEQTAVRNVFTAVDAALDRAALDPAGSGGAAVRAAAFCLAGVDWPEDERFWRDHVSRRYPGLGPFSVRNDGFATLSAGTPSGTGIAVVVGTGPAVAARAPDNTERCLGWWCFQHLGGGGLGADGLRAVYQAHQGLAPPTALTEILTGLYHAGSVPDLLHAFTRRADPIPPDHRSRAARVVLACAADGDPVARDIVDRHALAFAEYAWWVGRQAGFDTDRADIPVVLGGSVVTSHIPVLRELLAEQIKQRIPGALTTVVDVPPVIGALVEALALDDAPDRTVLSGQLAAAELPAELFHTD